MDVISGDTVSRVNVHPDYRLMTRKNTMVCPNGAASRVWRTRENANANTAADEYYKAGDLSRGAGCDDMEMKKSHRMVNVRSDDLVVSR